MKATNRAAVTAPDAVRAPLLAIDEYERTFPVASALRLAPLVFVRPGELRAAEWAEFDLDNAEWRLPAERMKMRAPHVVPLSTQAVAILPDLAPLAGEGRYLFPSIRTTQRPISENTINVALRRWDRPSTDMCGHGFRAMASTLLNEMGWPLLGLAVADSKCRARAARCEGTHGNASEPRRAVGRARATVQRDP